MLRCCAIDTKGEELHLDMVCRLKISKSSQVPADSLRLLLYGVYEELCRVYVYDENELVFTAIVDEQIVTMADNPFTELICRSTAAVLLDNEAKPKNFVNPYGELLFREYAEPLGFKGFHGGDKCLHGSFSTPKGVSCYEVLESFSLAVYGCTLRVKNDVVLFDGEEEKAELYFSDEDVGLPFTSFSYSKLRCKQLSTVFVKENSQDDYDTEITDGDALNKGILRQRYMDLSSDKGSSMADVYKAIGRSKVSCEEMSLVYPGRLLDAISAGTRIKFKGEEYVGFEVKSIDYVLSKDTEYTRLTLIRKEN